MEPRANRRQKAALTIVDVAQHAGVSTMTVSRVLNGESNVKISTRERVEHSIQELNYSPNPAARSLATGDVIRIGLLYSNPSAAYLSEFLVGSLDQCSRLNAQLVVEKCDEGREVDAAKKLAASGLDGILLPPPICDSPTVLASFQRSLTPVVAVATSRPGKRVAAVMIDDLNAAAVMTRHLLQLGHRRIGFISGHPNLTASGQRQAGYVAALNAAGIPIDDGLIVQGYFTYRSGFDAAEALLSLADRPTAIFASNDDMAVATVAAAHRAGLDVPHDISVCGFDDSAMATSVWPELTTIHQPIADMSREAVSLLVDEIRARRAGAAPEYRRVSLASALVERDSVGPPRQY